MIFVFFTLWRERRKLHGPFMSVCQSRFLGSRLPAWPGVIVARQWELTDGNPVGVLVVLPDVIAIPWPCLYHVRRGSAARPLVLPLSRTKPNPGNPGGAPNAYSKPGLFNSCGLTSEAFPREACFAGGWFPAVVVSGTLHRLLSRAVFWSSGLDTSVFRQC
jgi:hypothetical protein